MRFIVSEYHGKIYPGWKPPSDGSPKAFKKIKHEMDEILETVWQRRYSDSFPGSLGDLSGPGTLHMKAFRYLVLIHNT
jgi:hypothetical protein